MDAGTTCQCEQGLISTPYCPLCGRKLDAEAEPASIAYLSPSDASHAWMHLADSIMREYPPSRVGPRGKARRAIAAALAQHHLARGAGHSPDAATDTANSLRARTIEFREIVATADEKYIPFCGNWFADQGWERPQDYAGIGKANKMTAMRVPDWVKDRK